MMNVSSIISVLCNLDVNQHHLSALIVASSLFLGPGLIPLSFFNRRTVLVVTVHFSVHISEALAKDIFPKYRKSRLTKDMRKPLNLLSVDENDQLRIHPHLIPPCKTLQNMQLDGGTFR